MIVRTNKQKEVVKLSGSLSPLTTPQISWAFRKTQEHFAYRLKSGLITCMDCGHEWKEATDGTCRCPKCGALLQIKDTKDRVLKQKSFFNVITTKADYQVIPIKSDYHNGCVSFQQNIISKSSRWYWLQSTKASRCDNRD